jgi:1-acyl-sn-glycerol-3-phosphate acyltransferase
MNKTTTIAEGPTFLPAKPISWVIAGAQILNRLDLAWRNRLRLRERDLEVLRTLPRAAGIILASNHADETDMKACLELSRRCRRRFLYMMNREAFDEASGLAGWWLQRLGSFSVERGGHNEVAKRYAIDVVKRAQEVLVIFPEGEIYYLNDLVQPFKSGAVEIGMQAVVCRRRTQPDWTAYVVPLAIKYRYRRAIYPILEQKTLFLEQRLFRQTPADSLPRRLALIVAELLHRQEMIHHLIPDPDHRAALTDRVQAARRAVLSQIEEVHSGATADSKAHTVDRTWRLSSYLRNLLREGGQYSDERRAGFRLDLAVLKHVAQMGSWQPSYVDLDPSQERLAEMVLKLEREVYGIKRPRQLASRDVFLRIGEPIDLGQFVPSYLENPHATCHAVAEQLRAVIQGLINDIVSAPATTERKL